MEIKSEMVYQDNVFMAAAFDELNKSAKDFYERGGDRNIVERALNDWVLKNQDSPLVMIAARDAFFAIALNDPKNKEGG